MWPGFGQRRNLEVRLALARMEISNVAQLLRTWDNSDVHVIVTLIMPCLTAVCATVKRKPVFLSMYTIR